MSLELSYGHLKVMVRWLGVTGFPWRSTRLLFTLTCCPELMVPMSLSSTG
jgi:hypothetical protein